MDSETGSILAHVDGNSIYQAVGARRAGFETGSVVRAVRALVIIAQADREAIAVVPALKRIRGIGHSIGPLRESGCACTHGLLGDLGYLPANSDVNSKSDRCTPSIQRDLLEHALATSGAAIK
jgi:hypothetical protein